MALEDIIPDAITSITNMTGGVGLIQDDPDADDGDYIIVTVDGNDDELRVSFDAPVGTITQGAGLQTFKILIKRGTIAGSGNAPDFDAYLYEGGDVTTLVTGQTIGTSAVGEVFSYTWDAADLSDTSGADVEIRLFGNSSGGAPTAQRCMNVGAVRWIAEVDGAVTRRVFIT